MSDILTPCRKVCVLDPASGVCRGCGRNGDEIAGWMTMSNTERAQIMALLPGRLAALGLQSGAADAQ
jgi:predicted Fe-S protein YdhL (DUF1289 family)